MKLPLVWIPLFKNVKMKYLSISLQEELPDVGRMEIY